MEDVRPLVESGGYGAEALKRVDRSLDFVAALVDRLVEAGRSAARAAAALAVGPLVLALGDGVRAGTKSRTVGALKNFRAVATRYEKRAYMYHGTVTVAAIRLWIRSS
jgi:hypothetical protein